MVPTTENGMIIRLDALKALADTLADAINNCDSMRDMAALSRQYRETVREIDLIEGGETEENEVAVVIRRRQSSADE